MDIKAKVYKSNVSWLEGTASITIDDCFVVKGIKILNGKNGLFISMPNQKNRSGDYKDICFPITKEARQQIIDAIMEEYNKIDNTQNEKVLSDDDLPF